MLGDILYTVRFTGIDPQLFTSTVCADGVLPVDEIVDVINHTKNKMPLKSNKISTKNGRSPKKPIKKKKVSFAS